MTSPEMIDASVVPMNPFLWVLKHVKSTVGVVTPAPLLLKELSLGKNEGNPSHESQ